jgi:hypothetical protein
MPNPESRKMTPEFIVHWKDTTVAWKMAYEGLEWPVLSMVNDDTSDLVDPMVQYPPVVAPKCGRPVRTSTFRDHQVTVMVTVCTVSCLIRCV